MSRIGKLPVEIPSGVEVQVKEQQVLVKGKNGLLDVTLVGDVLVAVTDGFVRIEPANDSQRARAMWGLSRTLVNNMMVGVTQGFTKKMEIRGVGYRSSVEGRILRIALGYSHEIMIAIPSGLSVKTPKPTEIEIFGADKQRVGEFAAGIRRLRKPEPYKGKGARYEGERINMKEGKKK